MQKLINKPYLFCFGLALISLIIGLLFSQKSFYFAYYSGNISVNYLRVFFILFVFYILLGFNYFALHWAERSPKKWGTIFHLIFQTLSFILFVLYAVLIDKPTSYHQTDILNGILFISILLFIISLFIHFITFFISLLSK